MWVGLKSHRLFAFAWVRDLGYCAVQCLLVGDTAAMVSVQHKKVYADFFHAVGGPVRGLANVRRVDITAQSEQIAHQCLVRLPEVGPQDFRGTGLMRGPRGVSPETFYSRFQPVGSNVVGTQSKGGAT